MKVLKPNQLRPITAPQIFSFKTTAELADFKGVLGHQRAIDALNFGVGMTKEGYNIYAFGSPGLGKYDIVEQVITELAKTRPVPNDWCYVQNFADPERPVAIELPAGIAGEFKNDMRDLVKDIMADLTVVAIGERIAALQQQYVAFPAIVNYLENVQQDMIFNISELLAEKSTKNPFLNRYQINVIVNHAGQVGAPVVYENNPTYANLIGRIEHLAQYGALITDYSLIRAGALHKANGGFLILDACKVTNKKDIWDALKRILKAQAITIDTVNHTAESARSLSLLPDPIPLNIKVILVGDRYNYYYLSIGDPQFNDYFKVAVDFEEQIPRTATNNRLYAQLLGTIARRDNLRPLNRKAVAAVLDHSVRMAGDVTKLSMHILDIGDLIKEADYWAQQAQRQAIDVQDVKKALQRHDRRVDNLRNRLYEEIERKLILISTTGAKVGQINGLSVIELSNFMFGHPSRITAIARLGDGEVVDIQREVDLSGAVHSKGVMTIASFISGHYALQHPLSLSASIAFEQTYSCIEGDSASAAELCVVLSALAGVPIKQSLAITGSINQHGELQVIGAVNEKIEGFYDVCQRMGLTGEQGVIIPDGNTQSLMLREDVVEAVKQKKFHVYAVKHVNDAMTLLTGMTAGKRKANGKYPRDTVNFLVEQKLIHFAQIHKDEHHSDS